MMTPLVMAVVLNWNRRADTLACVASLRESTYAALRILEQLQGLGYSMAGREGADGASAVILER